MVLSKLLTEIYNTPITASSFINKANEIGYKEKGTIKHKNIYEIIEIINKHLIRKKYEIDMHINGHGEVLCYISEMKIGGLTAKGKNINTFKAFLKAYENLLRQQKNKEMMQEQEAI